MKSPDRPVSIWRDETGVVSDGGAGSENLQTLRAKLRYSPANETEVRELATETLEVRTDVLVAD